MDGFLLYQKIKGTDSKVKICFLTATEYFHAVFRRREGVGEFKQELFLSYSTTTTMPLYRLMSAKSVYMTYYIVYAIFQAKVMTTCLVLSLDRYITHQCIAFFRRIRTYNKKDLLQQYIMSIAQPFCQFRNNKIIHLLYVDILS